MGGSWFMLNDYVKGLRYLDEPFYEWTQLTLEEVREYFKTLSMTETIQVAAECNTYKEFASKAPCVTHYSKCSDKEQAFYYTKSGFYIKGVHPYLVYKIMLELLSPDVVYNKIPDKLNKILQRRCFTPGYIKDGKTLEWVLKKVSRKDFKLVDENEPVTFIDNNAEVYFEGSVYKVTKQFLEQQPYTKWHKSGKYVYTENGIFVG